MKHFTILLCAAALMAVLSGCISKEIEPQQVVVNPQDGSLIIFKDLYEINSDSSIHFGNSRVFPLYNANAEGLPGNYDLNIIVIEPNRSSALFTQKVSQIIYVLTGGGILNIDGKAYELREGISLYIPADRKLKFINDSPYVLKCLEISTPSSEAAPIILQETPAAEDADKLTDKELLKKSEEVLGNANTSPTLDQITPISLEDNSRKAEAGDEPAPDTSAKPAEIVPQELPAAEQTGAGSDSANTAIIDKSGNSTDPPPVKPLNRTSETLTTEEKIMQDVR